MNDDGIRILVLGANGLLGNAIFRFLSGSAQFDVRGAVRSAPPACMDKWRDKLIVGFDANHPDNLLRLFDEVRPAVVINCVGLIKQFAESANPLIAIPINSILPHRLTRLCALGGARLVHFSTDCVFSGKSGMYTESDLVDASDLYGRSKHLGETSEAHTITLRTSIIGHETGRPVSLIGWFLAQERQVKGYTRAVFSGLPTVEIARVLRDYVIPNPGLSGLYHLSAEPISKFDLLNLVAEIYGKKICIIADDALVIDRSLDSSRFRRATGFVPSAWPDLVKAMKQFG